ncbi:MAG TPA: enolase C-terminal domain-like protein [Candidatus Binatia bacterium]|nr:enolase C-terminal domain-like protein [Candidatus Binatia bacterium]
MLKLRQVDVMTVVLPFRITFRHALASRSEGEVIVVRVTDTEGRVGFGESVPRDYVTGETIATVRETLGQILVPPLLGVSFSSFEEIAATLKHFLDSLPRNHNAAFCALELSVLDLAGRVFGRSAGSVAGNVESPEVRYSGVISADGVQEALDLCKKIAALGLRDVKVKVGLSTEADREILKGARRILGEGCSLRVDANCAWRPEEALRYLETYTPIRLDGVEQPIAHDDVDGLAWLTERSPVPVIVDESLASFDDGRVLIERRACHGFNIRISKCGGLLGSFRLRDMARQAGLGFMLGAQVGETAILSAAGRQFATRSRDVRFCEGSFGSFLLEHDIGLQDLTFGQGGKAPALDGPGLGVEVDQDQLSRLVTERMTIGGE